MSNLDDLSLIALKASIKAEEAKREADEAKANFIEALQEAGKFNSDFKATEHVRVKLVPNRWFDVEEALAEIPKTKQKAVMVTKPDPKLLKQRLTPLQVEKHMKSYAVPFKLSLAVLDD